MTLFAFSGLGAYNGVFNNLNINAEIVPIPYAQPHENEPIEVYTRRLLQNFRPSGEFGFIGISFGGVVATEAAKLFGGKALILVSSIRTKNDIPTRYRLVAKTGILDKLPGDSSALPDSLAGFVLGEKQKNMLGYVLDKMSGSFTRWAIKQMLLWNGQDKLHNTLMLSGSNDNILPPSSKENDQIVIEGGGHFMVYDRGQEISKHINGFLNHLNTNATPRLA
jgi:pimeloyl-ACP methyl ester carboxylesterase